MTAAHGPTPAPTPTHLADLAAMLAPYTPGVFATEYWCQRPLFIKGSPAKLQRLFPGGFTRQDFYRAARTSAAAQNQGFQLLARGPQERFVVNGPGPRPSLPIQPDQMEWLFANGANLRADNVLDARLSRFAVAIKAQLQHVGQVYVAATLSPRGNGWPAHIDRTSVIFIQAEGRKRFTISPRPVAPWPDKGALLGVDGTVTERDGGPPAAWEEIPPADMSDVFDVVLEPGDLLFLPPGTIHATEALTEGSLTLDVLFSHASFLDLLMSTLDGALKADPNWRHLPAVDVTRAEPGQLPAEAAAFMSARLGEVRRFLDTLTPTGLELNRQWQRAVADPGAITLGIVTRQLAAASLSQPPSSPSPTARLRLSTRAPITIARGTTDDGEATLDLFFAGKEISVTGAWVPFLATLVSVRRFTAGAATRWAEGEAYPWDTVAASLATMLEQGMLEHDLDGTVTAA